MALALIHWNGDCHKTALARLGRETWTVTIEVVKDQFVEVHFAEGTPLLQAGCVMQVLVESQSVGYLTILPNPVVVKEPPPKKYLAWGYPQLDPTYDNIDNMGCTVWVWVGMAIVAVVGLRMIV